MAARSGPAYRVTHQDHAALFIEDTAGPLRCIRRREFRHSPPSGVAAPAPDSRTADGYRRYSHAGRTAGRYARNADYLPLSRRPRRYIVCARTSSYAAAASKCLTHLAEHDSASKPACGDSLMCRGYCFGGCGIPASQGCQRDLAKGLTGSAGSLRVNTAGAASDAARSEVGQRWKRIGQGQTSGTTGRTYPSWCALRRISRTSGGRE